MEDINLYDESMPVYDRREDILEEDEDKEETVDESYLNYISEDANYSEENCYPVFIILQHSGTIGSNIIKKATNAKYTHAAISFNSEMSPLYTFGYKDYDSIFGKTGFVVQTPTDEFYTLYKVKYAVYVMYVNQSQYEAMQNALNRFIKKKDEWEFDMSALISVWLNRPTEKSKKYFCSRFVAEIINAGYKLNKVPSLYKPQDLKYLNNITLVNKGYNFRYYDSSITDANLEYIKSHDFKSISVHESNEEYSYEALPTKPEEVVFDLPEIPTGSDIRTILDNTDPKHIYFTSDWHITKNHYKHEANYVNTAKIAKWCRDNIKDNDVFFYLGDIAFRYANEEDQKNSQEIMSKIPGIKVFILGNHDKMLGQEYFTACGFDYVFEELEWKNYIFTHEPINMDTKPSNMLNIHGHIHNMETYNTTDGKRNVNVYPMWYDNKPVTLDYIINHVDELTKNHSWNWNAGYSEAAVDFSEAMMLPQKDLIYHKNEFDSGEINLAFIVGFSGSGKTVMARQLADKYDNCDYIELDDVLSIDHFSDDNLKEYSSLLYDFFTGSGKKYRVTYQYLVDNHISENDYERPLIKDIIDYAISYAKSHKDKRFILEGIWPLVYGIDPSKFKDCMVCIKGTPYLASTIRAFNRDTKDMPFFKKISYFARFQLKHFKGMGLDLNKGIKEYTQYFKSHAGKDELVSEAKRSELPDSSFGIPEDRKYPLDTEQHVRSAIKLFGHAEESKKKSLAKRIRAAAKRYDISIPETTQCYKYLNEAMADIIPNDVTNVIFDLGSVLVDYDYEASLRMNPDIPNEFVSDIKDAIYAYLFFPIEPDDERHIQMLGVDQAIERFERLAPEHIKPYAKEAIESFRFNTVFNYDYTDQLIEKCKQQGYNIYYLSNWAKYTYILQKSYFDILLPKFNGGIMSYEVDMLKPDPEIYIALCDKYNLDPSKCIFFDDKAANVEGAKRIGMRAYVFDTKTTPQILLNEGINIPVNADDYLLIQTSRGLRNLPIDKINQWYASDSRETPSINIDQYSVTANDAIYQAINKLTDAKAFDKEIYIPLYVFANSLFFTGNESNNAPICIGQVNAFPSNDFEWVIQYPLKINGDAIESVKEYSMANTNPVIGIGRSFMINTGEKLAYAQDIEPEKCLVVNDDGILEVQPTDSMQISEVYEFTGNKAYVNRLNKLYKESAKVDNIYSILTSKPLLSNDQIRFDESFRKVDFDLLEQKALSEFATLKDQIIAACGMKGLNGFVLESAVHNINPVFMSKYNILGDISIKEDFDGVYFYSNLTRKRSASVKSLSMLTENMLIAIL